MADSHDVGETRESLAWPWLFPVTLLAHLAEEYWGGFPGWASELAGINLTPELFLSINIPFVFIMTAMVAIAATNPSARWILVCFGALVLLNGLLHTALSVLTASYSPGAVTGLLLWVPLGWFTLNRLKKTLSATHFGLAVAAGIGIHALATATALSTG